MGSPRRQSRQSKLEDLTLTNSGEVGSCFGVAPSQGLACVGPLSILGDTYQGFVGPTNFGPGDLQLARSESGDFTSIVPLPGNLHPPSGYISGDSLFGEVTFANSDFTSLGLMPGTYVWSWGVGAHAIRSPFRLASQSPRPGRRCWRDLAAVAGRERLGRSAEAKEAVAEPPERSRLLGRARQEALG